MGIIITQEEPSLPESQIRFEGPSVLGYRNTLDGILTL